LDDRNRLNKWKIPRDSSLANKLWPRTAQNGVSESGRQKEEINIQVGEK
jgi:hypothetical protein